MISPDMGFQPGFPRNEAAIRIGCFLFPFAVIVFAEIVVSGRPLTVKKSSRWFGNVSIHLVNGLLPRRFFPILTAGISPPWAQKGWGLLLDAVALPMAVGRRGMTIGLKGFQDSRNAGFRWMIMNLFKKR